MTVFKALSGKYALINASFLKSIVCVQNWGPFCYPPPPN